MQSGGNSFKIALFTNSQAGNDNLGGTSTDMDATVTGYSSSAGNEVGNSGDYLRVEVLSSQELVDHKHKQQRL